MKEGTLKEVLENRAGWTVVEGDAIETMKQIDRVDHVLTDPPYEAEAHTTHRRVKRSGTAKGERWGAGDSREAMTEAIGFDPIQPEERLRAGVEFARLARRWSLVFCQVEASQLWRGALEIGGHTYKRTCVWIKPDGQPQFAGDRPGMGYESIVATHAPGRSLWNGGGRLGVFSHVKNTPGGAVHPTQKPLPLMSELVRLFSDMGDLILDPYAGSGSTGVAAVRHGRRFIGVERDPKHATTARDRIRRALQFQA